MSDKARKESAFRVVLAAIAGVTLLLGAIVAVRLAREPAVPAPPRPLAELGPPPAGGPWDVLVRERRHLERAPGPDALHARLLDSVADETLVLDAPMRESLAELDRVAFAPLPPIVEAVFSGAPLEDRCTDAAPRCPGIEMLRAAQAAELVVLDRWIAGDRRGAASLLGRVLAASLELARTGRAVMAQMVGISTLSRAAGLLVVLVRDGLVLDPALALVLERVERQDLDLGRGWIAEMSVAEHALRTIPDDGILERLLLDRGVAARAIYDAQERCVLYARDASAPRPASLPLPSGQSSLYLSTATELAFIEALLPDCAPMIDEARSRFARARARLALARAESVARARTEGATRAQP